MWFVLNRFASQFRRRFERQQQILADVFVRNFLNQRKLDVPTKFAFAFQDFMLIRKRRARPELQRNVLCVRKNAAKRTVSREQKTAVFHFFGDSRIQSQNEFSQLLNKLELGLIVQSYVLE